MQVSLRGFVAAALLLGAEPLAAQNRIPVLPPPTGWGETCLPVPFTAPTYVKEVDLAPFAVCGLGGGGANPFSVAWTEDGSRAYATLFGGLIGSSGCTVVRLHPLTLEVQGTITSGLGPEELAFVTFPNGDFRYGFVTDSSASTVTVFNAADQVVATIAIPFDPQANFPTAFPYGVAVHPDGSRVYVGTLDGQGFVHVIDVETLSLIPSQRIELGPEHGAGQLRFSEGQLIIPANEFLPGFVGSVAKLCVVDPARPSVIRSVELAREDNGFLFPSLQDIAVDCSGLVWAAGFDLGARVFAIDPFGPAGPRIVQRIDTETSAQDGNFQCLALTDEGVLWVGDLLVAEIALIDVREREWMMTLDADDLPGFYQAPHDIAFSPDGRRAAVVWAASDNLSVFEL